MTLHFKVSGEWEQVARPYIKVGGLWKAVNEVWVKDSGTWERSYEYDVTPPDPPTISVELIETTYWEMVDGTRERKTGRHLKIGVRSPLIAHDPDLKLIRVLSRQADGSPPTTQFGTTYIRGADTNFPHEPWSDFSFNGHNRSSLTKDSSLWRYKTFPNNATASSQVAAGRYYFTAWALDDANNWSVASPVEIVVPKKGSDAADVIPKSGRFQSNNSGTNTSTGFTAGSLVQAPRQSQRGFWVYGQKIKEAIGQQGKPFIKSAQILVHRKNDTGEAQARVWLFWHEYGSVGDIPLEAVRHQPRLLGTIGKGESKWFNIPDEHHVNMEAGNVRGFGLNNKDPNAAAATASDYSEVKGTTEHVRAGEVYVVWTEKPGAS